MTEVLRVKRIIDRIRMDLMGIRFHMRVEQDNKYHNGLNGRVFIQVVYDAPCTKTGETGKWKGRKWYLSEHMTDDEIVKTAWVAFESAVKHEVMEGFRVDGKILFNPHTSFEDILNLPYREVKREEHPKVEDKLFNTVSPPPKMIPRKGDLVTYLDESWVLTMELNHGFVEIQRGFKNRVVHIDAVETTGRNVLIEK